MARAGRTIQTAVRATGPGRSVTMPVTYAQASVNVALEHYKEKLTNPDGSPAGGQASVKSIISKVTPVPNFIYSV